MAARDKNESEDEVVPYKKRDSRDSNNGADIEEMYGGEDEEDENHSNCAFWCILIAMVVLVSLGALDSVTTGYFRKMCSALAVWTMENAPLSFLGLEFIVFLFLVFCLPFGPLSVLSGALFYQKYGKNGIFFGFFALLLATFSAACLCFFMARKYFREAVRMKVKRNPKLHLLTKLDKLIKAGHGLEMVLLIRIAPMANGPTNYFLGTTCVKWKDFIIGSLLIGMPECFIDIMMGAGANEVDLSNPTSVAIFALAVALFLVAMCLLGRHAHHIVLEMEEREADEVEFRRWKTMSMRSSLALNEFGELDQQQGGRPQHDDREGRGSQGEPLSKKRSSSRGVV